MSDCLIISLRIYQFTYKTRTLSATKYVNLTTLFTTLIYKRWPSLSMLSWTCRACHAKQIYRKYFFDIDWFLFVLIQTPVVEKSKLSKAGMYLSLWWMFSFMVLESADLCVVKRNGARFHGSDISRRNHNIISQTDAGDRDVFRVYDSGVGFISIFFITIR